MMTFYTGLWNKEDYNKYWKDLNLSDRLTNVTSDYDTALNFSGDDLMVICIENVPIEAIIGVRKKSYDGDEDFKDISLFPLNKKMEIINKSQMFLLELLPYKNQIKISLV